MKLMVIGHARHGKDTVCELLGRQYGLKFTSSSLFCAGRIMMPLFGDKYKTVEECFADRSNHRAFWYDSINQFNTPDPTRLARLIYAENDVYCGIRHWAEFKAVKEAKLFDYCIWVDATLRMPSEGKDSMSLTSRVADYVLDNNGPIEALEGRLWTIMNAITSITRLK